MERGIYKENGSRESAETCAVVLYNYMHCIYSLTSNMLTILDITMEKKEKELVTHHTGQYYTVIYIGLAFLVV